MNKTTGKLYVVATPIGNLGDMVPRAVEVLQSVDVIAAEDTRRTGQLCSHFDIRTPLRAYHDHNEEAQADKLIELMGAGKDIALVSDAGMPLISDPGYRLPVSYTHLVNAEKITVTGNKAQGKKYYRHTEYPGGLKETTFEKLIVEHPERPLRFAVKGMLPRGPLGRAMLKKLKIYEGSEHPHTAQQPQELSI